MIEPHPLAVFQELSARGLIAATPAPQPLGRGNADRQDTAARSSWLVALPAGGQAKLTLGRDLSTLAARHAALVKACPTITTPLLAQASIPGGEFLLETYFAGPTLESAATDHLLPPAVLRQALTTLCTALAATEQSSTETARATEWAAWTRQLLALPVWQPAEISTLQTILLPALYARLATEPAVTRWTNGDFLPANILLNARGEARLIDAEFASRTHFFAEDAVRFHVLSSAVQDAPDLFAGLVPTPALPWHLYFWLRQFHLEIAHNTPAYVARVQPVRLGLIRRLAEQLPGTPLDGWSAPALLVESSVEDIRWLPDTNRAALISGWCHVPAATRLRALVVHDRTGRLTAVPPSARPDVQQHFHREPRALLSGFALTISPGPGDFPITLCAVIDNGTLVPFRGLTADDLPRGALSWEDYPAWAARYDSDPVPPAPTAPKTGPLLSLLLPVYKTPESYLRECLDSVRAQHYPHWELCVVDDGSALPSLTADLQRWAAADPRIRIQTRATNGGISRATNDALAMAQGEFIVLLDHDDLLRPQALAAFADRLTQEPALDALYSDEDKITAEGRRLLPFLKPDFSPEFLLGVMYIGHALGVRTTVARAAGGFDPAYDGIQDYEFFLRVTERTQRIGHLPQLLYHWRQSPGSSALHGNIKGDMDKKQAAAVQAHLQRRGDQRTAHAGGGHRVRLKNPVHPGVTLVPAADEATALAALRQAAATSTAEVLVLLSGEPPVFPDDSLQELAAVAALPDSGCVAPLLLSAEGRVYESGRVGAHPVMRGFHPGSDGYHGSLSCTREVDAVSPICVALRRTLVTAAPGSLGEDWPGFCAQLRARGLYHRVCASARVQLNRPWIEATAAPADASASREFYHPLFDPARGDYSLVAPARDQASPEISPAFYIDQPVEWDSLPRCIIIRGWCFSRQSPLITGIRLQLAELTLSGVVGLARPDVSLARPDAPHGQTGFEIRGTLPGGRHVLRLEARLGDGTWCRLIERTVSVRRQILPLWLGGGDWMELMFFQMPAHMAYAARKVRPQKFPAPTASPRPRLSIVTPSFNQARFLPETMRSVLEQTGVTCDYVVQDGGSTDGSKELIASLGETGDGRQEAGENETGVPASEFRSPVSGLRPPVRPRLLRWSSEADAGQADAISRAFAKTSGGADDLMAWINSDDFYLPGTLGYVADYFARHPDVDVVYGHRIVVNEESQEIGRWFLPQHDPAVLRLNDFVPQETLFWRRRIWEKAGGLDPSFQFAMDWDLLLRFQAAGAKIVRLPRFLACFRVHAAQKTSARMHDVGQQEITRLRERTFGRPFPPHELEQSPLLLRYLRRSAFIGFLWRLGLRTP